MRPARVAHLTSVHSPTDIRIYHREGATLAAGGYDLAVIGPWPDGPPPERVVPVARPSGRLARLTRTAWRVYREALRARADLYHFHDPELIPVGLALKLLHGKRVVYDVHEDLPRQVLSKPWIPAPLRRLVSGAAALAEGIGARCFDGIAAATPRIAQRFPPAKTVLVQNFPASSEFGGGLETPYAEREPLVVYTGGVSVIQGACEMLRSMTLLPSALGARLVIAGLPSPPGFAAELPTIDGYDRTEFRGWQGRDAIRELLGQARVGLVVDHPTPNYVESYSTKMFEFMAAGLPVVASDFPLWRDIVEGAGCGLVVYPLDPVAIAEALAHLLAHPAEAEAMGKRGQLASRQRYHWAPEGARLLELYQRLLR